MEPLQAKDRLYWPVIRLVKCMTVSYKYSWMPSFYIGLSSPPCSGCGFVGWAEVTSQNIQFRLSDICITSMTGVLHQWHMYYINDRCITCAFRTVLVVSWLLSSGTVFVDMGSSLKNARSTSCYHSMWYHMLIRRTYIFIIDHSNAKCTYKLNLCS